MSFNLNVQKIRLMTYKYPIIGKLLYPLILFRRLILQKKYSQQDIIYKNLCELLVEDPIIKVDEFQGVFVINSRSVLFKRLLINKEYEPLLVNLVLKHLNINLDAIDVGANIGFYTVLFAKKLNSGRVLSIEPTKNALNRLYKNIKLNNVMDRVIVFEGAVSDCVSSCQIKTMNGKEEYSTLGKWCHPCIEKENFITYKIEVSTIDNLVKEFSLEPGFIKIDVEGVEHLVLKGAKSTLMEKRPVILSELSNPLLKQNSSSSLDVINFLKSLDYVVLNAEDSEIKPEFIEFTNILAIPVELYR